MEKLYEGVDFYDDVNQLKPLDRKRVIRARMDEIRYFTCMGVYKKVSKEEQKVAPQDACHPCSAANPMDSSSWEPLNKSDSLVNLLLEFLSRELYNPILTNGSFSFVPSYEKPCKETL